MSKTFEVSAMGDLMYFAAPDLADAKEQFSALCGDVPDGLLCWREVSSLPDGNEYAEDIRPGAKP